MGQESPNTEVHPWVKAERQKWDARRLYRTRWAPRLELSTFMLTTGHLPTSRGVSLKDLATSGLAFSAGGF